MATAGKKTGQPDNKARKRSASRMRSPERREQIVETTLALVAKYGVPGTTLTRIASAVGVTTPALYAHFANRREILLEALEVLIRRRSTAHHLVTEGAPLERLREIGHRHSELVASDDTSVLALFEFIAAGPEEGLRETLGERHLGLLDELARIVEEGQEDGTIIRGLDPQQIAWMMVSRAWTEDIAALMGISHAWNQERSNQMLELILDSIAAPTREETPPTE